MLGYPPTPPPPPGGGLAADRPTRQPPRFGSTKGGGRVPPPHSPPNCCTPLGVTHWLAAAPVSHGRLRVVRPCDWLHFLTPLPGSLPPCLSCPCSAPPPPLPLPVPRRFLFPDPTLVSSAIASPQRVDNDEQQSLLDELERVHDADTARFRSAARVRRLCRVLDLYTAQLFCS